MKTDRSNRVRFPVASILGISLVTLAFGCQPSPNEGGSGFTSRNGTGSMSSSRAEQNGWFATHSVMLADGTLAEMSIINGPPHRPDGLELESASADLPRADLAAGINTLAVPAYRWSFGCSATSAAMIAAYYDRNGYDNMYTGPTNAGVMPDDSSVWPDWSDGSDSYAQDPLAASHNGLDGRTTRGSIDDYWVSYESTAKDPYITGKWTQHTWSDAVGDYMKTSQSSYKNVDGSTVFYTLGSSKFTCAQMKTFGVDTKDGSYGRKLFYEARGYTVTDCYAQSTDNMASGGFSFAQYKAEIDAHRPVMLNLKGHTVVGVGYNDSDNTVYLHNTWDFLTYPMPWGGSYEGMQLQSASIVNLVARPVPAAPTGVNATDGVYNGEVRVSWTASDGATSYQVYRNSSNASSGATQIGTPSASPYSDTLASPAVTYYYFVKACNSAGCSDFSLSDSGYRAPLVSIPSPPTGVSASDGTDTDKVVVSWSASTGASSYKVFRNTSDLTSGASELPTPPTASPYNDATATPGTTYYYFVQACNEGGCSDYSGSDSGYAAIPYSLGGVTPNPAAQTGQVTVTWTAPAGHSTSDWVGVFVAGTTDTQYLTYKRVPAGTTGTLTYTVDGSWAKGSYELRYFINDTFQKEATVGFMVTDSGYGLGGVTPDPAPQAGQVTVTWTAPADHSTSDWVAVVAAGAGNTQYLTYKRVPTGTTGTLTYTVDGNWAKGSYEFRYFINDTFQKAATVGFTVTDSGYILGGVTPDPAPQAGQVTVTWNAPAGHSTIDWVAVFAAGAADTQYLTYQWVPAGTTGTLTYTVDSSWAKGSYELRYFINNTFQKAATVGFTVTDSGYSLSGVTPIPAPQAGQVTVTWNAPAGHSTIDWVAVFAAGAADTQYLTYQWVPAGTTGMLTYTVDSSWAKGSYELRYFINNTFQNAATVGFTVTDSGYSLSGVTPNPAPQGGQVTVTWGAPDGHSTIDWVGVFAAGTADTQYLTYRWVPVGMTGTLTYTVDSSWAKGSYELRYFINNTFQKAATVGFTVGP